MVEKQLILSLFGVNELIEIIGIIASVLVLVSMCVKSSNKRGNIVMRIINTIGSIVFIYYGLVLHAYSTAFLNAGAVIVNAYHIIKLIRSKDS